MTHLLSCISLHSEFVILFELYVSQFVIIVIFVKILMQVSVQIQGLFLHQYVHLEEYLVTETAESGRGGRVEWMALLASRHRSTHDHWFNYFLFSLNWSL